jgi:hypothetical protein
VQLLIERFGGTEQRFEGQRADDVGGVEAVLESGRGLRRESGDELRAIDERQPFFGP